MKIENIENFNKKCCYDKDAVFEKNTFSIFIYLVCDEEEDYERVLHQQWIKIYTLQPIVFAGSVYKMMLT